MKLLEESIEEKLPDTGFDSDFFFFFGGGGGHQKRRQQKQK